MANLYESPAFRKTVIVVPDPPHNIWLGLKHALPFLVVFWGLVAFALL